MDQPEAVPDGVERDAGLGLLRAVPHGVAVLDAGGRLTYANEALVRQFAWPSAAELVGRPWRELFDAEEAARLEQDALAPAQRGGSCRVVATGRRHDGISFPQELVFVSLGGGRVALVVRDVTEFQRTEERLSALVYRDELDRAAESPPLRRPPGHRPRPGPPLPAPSRGDLPRPRPLQAGERHPRPRRRRRAAEGGGTRLSSCVREGDTVARLAGDEFTLLLPGIHYAEDLAAISRKLTEALRKPFQVEGHDVRVTASGGISLYPEDGESAAALVRSADTAMYRAKERGRDNFQLFSPAMAEKALERRALEESLRRALENREMTLHYQPCLALATGRVVGVGRSCAGSGRSWAW